MNMFRKEISHILGLKNNPHDSLFQNESWFLLPSVESAKNRYKNLTKNELAFNPIKNLSQSDFSNQIKALSIGDYQGFATQWKNHAFTLQAIRDKNGTHFVYINRGDRHLNATDKDTVRVFTVPVAELEQFSQEIYDVFTSEDQQTVSNFILKNEAYSTRPDTLQKSNQKVGNCSMANSNVAWHFQLAASYLKDNPNSTFEQALQHTKGAYKELRKQDRIEAFKQLLMLPINDTYPKEAHRNDVLQALSKLANKDEVKGENYIQILLQDKEISTELTRLLTESDFSHHRKNFLGDNLTEEMDVKREIERLEDLAEFEENEELVFEYDKKIAKLNEVLIKIPRMEKMRDNILRASFSNLHPIEQRERITQDPALARYALPSVTSEHYATRIQLAQLLRECDSKTAPKLVTIIPEDSHGDLIGLSTANDKPCIITSHHMVELKNNGDFTVFNLTPFPEINTNEAECAKIVYDLLLEIPEKIMIQKLKSAPSAIMPKNQSSAPDVISQLNSDMNSKRRRLDELERLVDFEENETQIQEYEDEIVKVESDLQKLQDRLLEIQASQIESSASVGSHSTSKFKDQLDSIKLDNEKQDQDYDEGTGVAP